MPWHTFTACICVLLIFTPIYFNKLHARAQKHFSIDAVKNLSRSKESVNLQIKASQRMCQCWRTRWPKTNDILIFLASENRFSMIKICWTMQFNWKNGNLTVCFTSDPWIHVPISICLHFLSLIQIEYAFDYVILFAINEKRSTPCHDAQLCFWLLCRWQIFRCRFLYRRFSSMIARAHSCVSHFMLCPTVDNVLVRILIDVLSFVSLIQL